MIIEQFIYHEDIQVKVWLAFSFITLCWLRVIAVPQNKWEDSCASTVGLGIPYVSPKVAAEKKM